jgi:hypothetical protein
MGFASQHPWLLEISRTRVTCSTLLCELAGIATGRFCNDRSWVGCRTGMVNLGTSGEPGTDEPPSAYWAIRSQAGPEAESHSVTWAGPLPVCKYPPCWSAVAACWVTVLTAPNGNKVDRGDR